MVVDSMNGKYVAVDLFSGTGSATKYFRESEDWIVYGYDIAPDQPEDTEIDIMDLEPEDLPENVDFVWASPPCKSFSIASIGHHYNKKNDRLRIPDSESGFQGVQMLYKALWLIQEMNPEYWFLENPRGGMRKVIGEPQYEQRERGKPDRENPGTVTYCQYGDDRMKPTDLWGVHPEGFEYRFCGNGKACHVTARRGASTGTQGRDPGSDRWRLPDGLAEHVFETVRGEFS